MVPLDPPSVIPARLAVALATVRSHCPRQMDASLLRDRRPARADVYFLEPALPYEDMVIPFGDERKRHHRRTLPMPLWTPGPSA
jgi:hypothetical protein